MNIIKLNAINSTNDYLKTMAAKLVPENFTVVTAEMQTKGRGQMGAVWNTEEGKNLTFSVLLKDALTGTGQIFTLNVAVAYSIATALSGIGISNVSIKWPNDILAGNKKVAGVLIENSIKSDGRIFSVVGIGINVNQVDFTDLPKATSLKVHSGNDFVKDDVLMSVLKEIENHTQNLQENSGLLWENYHSMLYRKGIPTPFETKGVKLMGIIQQVTASGMLQVLHDDDTVKEYGIKEIQLLY